MCGNLIPFKCGVSVTTVCFIQTQVRSSKPDMLNGNRPIFFQATHNACADVQASSTCLLQVDLLQSGEGRKYCSTLQRVLIGGCQAIFWVKAINPQQRVRQVFNIWDHIKHFKLVLGEPWPIYSAVSHVLFHYVPAGEEDVTLDTLSCF